jgi:hypothetical protein
MRAGRPAGHRCHSHAPLASGVFPRVMAEGFPEINVLDVARRLLSCVFSPPPVDVAPVGMREPQFVELSNEISDDVTSRINLVMLRDQCVL